MDSRIVPKTPEKHCILNTLFFLNEEDIILQKKTILQLSHMFYLHNKYENLLIYKRIQCMHQQLVVYYYHYFIFIGALIKIGCVPT